VYAATTCDVNNKCPSDTPCCSQYGQCGVGAYCLGGCDPRSSFALDSCAPAPVCKSEDFKFTNLDGVTANTKYLGDASQTNWVSSGQPIMYQGQQVLLTMAPDTVGTLLASAHYLWYGKVSATMKTSRGAGVVTAFILLSDVKDEIDFEFIGTDLVTAQSNFYFQGIPNYWNEKNISVDSSTFDDYHTYEIDWTPDSITWSIDGQVGRTLDKNTTWNATANRYEFPQTPARIQLSLWPGGLASNGQGTIEWAGGLVDWNSQDIKNFGYDYAMVKEVNVECYQPPSGANVTGSKSYIYNSPAGTNDTVALTNDNTILKSFIATGTNMSADDSSSSASASASSKSTKSAAPQVPGMSGSRPGSDSSSSSSTASSGSSQPTSSSSSSGT
ncbi:glycoside hydrolase family 16 protein, partial [Xylona heveae TC161]